MSGEPSVSVVTATRNRPELLCVALESIAAQDFQDYEAIVGDDGSDRDVQEQDARSFAGCRRTSDCTARVPRARWAAGPPRREISG